MSLTVIPGGPAPEPTERQMEIIRWVAEYIRREHGMCPALSEVPADRAVIDACERGGWLTRKPVSNPGARRFEGRTLRPTEAGRELLKKHEVKP